MEDGCRRHLAGVVGGSTDQHRVVLELCRSFGQFDGSLHALASDTRNKNFLRRRSFGGRAQHVVLADAAAGARARDAAEVDAVHFGDAAGKR